MLLLQPISWMPPSSCRSWTKSHSGRMTGLLFVTTVRVKLFPYKVAWAEAVPFPILMSHDQLTHDVFAATSRISLMWSGSSLFFPRMSKLWSSFQKVHEDSPRRVHQGNAIKPATRLVSCPSIIKSVYVTQLICSGCWCAAKLCSFSFIYLSCNPVFM